MSQSLSYLMAAPKISDQELQALDIEIVGTDGDARKLKIPGGSLAAYKDLVAEKLDPGFWNDLVNDHEMSFIFKFKDGSVKRIQLVDEKTQAEVAQLCHEFNGDPLEKTSDVPMYLAENEFYREFMHQTYL